MKVDYFFENEETYMTMFNPEIIKRSSTYYDQGVVFFPTRRILQM